MTRVDVVGAGVVGTIYGVQLAAAGHDVRLVARGDRLRQLEGGAAVVDTVTGVSTAPRLDVAEDVRPDAEAVLVTVGAHQLRDAAAIAGDGDGPIVLLGNGVGDMTAGLDAALVGFPGAGGTIRDGVVRCYDADKGKRFPVTIDARHPAAPAVAALFRSAGVPVDAVADISGWRHTHHAVVVAIVGALALCGGSAQRLSATPDAQLVLGRAVKESFTALRRLGHRLTPPHLARFRRVPEPLLKAAVARMFAGDFAVRRFEAHHAHAAEEFRLLAGQQRDLLDAAGVVAPHARLLCDRLQDPGGRTLLVGSRDLPVDWTAPLRAAALLTLALRRRRR